MLSDDFYTAWPFLLTLHNKRKCNNFCIIKFKNWFQIHAKIMLITLTCVCWWWQAFAFLVVKDVLKTVWALRYISAGMCRYYQLEKQVLMEDRWMCACTVITRTITINSCALQSPKHMQKKMLYNTIFIGTPLRRDAAKGIFWKLRATVWAKTYGLHKACCTCLQSWAVTLFYPDAATVRIQAEKGHGWSDHKRSRRKRGRMARGRELLLP